jgi:hypothetical protein
MKTSRALLVLAFTLFTTQAYCGEVLTNWHWRNPLPQGNAIYNVVSANGNIVAVGELGTILTSTDGTNWTTRKSGTVLDLRDCAFGAGQYVVVGDYGTVLTSTNLETWIPQYAGTFYSLRGIIFGDGKFVCVGDQTAILTSSDGVNWATQGFGPWQLEDVIYGEGLFVAAGGVSANLNQPSSRVILTSNSGQEWVIRALAEGPSFRSLAYGDERFGVTTTPDSWNGWSSIWSSDDGLDWQPLPPVVMTAYRSRLTYGNGLWVLVNGAPDYPIAPGDILWSPDLVNWTLAYSNSQSLSAVCFSGNRFVAAGFNGAIVLSNTGTNWISASANDPDLFFASIDFLNGEFVGMNHEHFFFSTNGAAWTKTPMPTNTGRLLNLTFGNGLHVAGGEYRTIWISTNRTEWSNPIPELSRHPYIADTRVAFGNGVFVGASGFEGDILTSPDGTNWTVQTLVTNEGDYVYFRDLTFANGRFVAVDLSTIATSVDGTNWHVLRTNLYLHSVAGGAGRFVAVGGNTLATSTDGTNWVTQTSNDPGTLTDVAFGAGWFVVTTGPIYSSSTPIKQPRPYWISPDGINWTRRTFNTPQAMGTIAFGDGSFITSTERGGLLQSDPLVTLALNLGAIPELQISGPRFRQYQIEYSDVFAPTNGWSSLGTFIATNDPAVFNDWSGTNTTQRLYRAALLP